MKAILVIDMPRDCEECPLFDEYQMRCYYLKNDKYAVDVIPSWCPLRELPGYEINNDKANQYHQRFCNGWNAMIDYCLNKDEEDEDDE